MSAPLLTTSEKERVPQRAAAYAAYYPLLVDVARAHGYAMAIHGSLQRDFDLVAVPWSEEATDALTLIRALKEATGGVTKGEDMDEWFKDCHPKQKPHGRVAYSVHFSNRGLFGAYLDISVMPRIPKA